MSVLTYLGILTVICSVVASMRLLARTWQHQLACGFALFVFGQACTAAWVYSHVVRHSRIEAPLRGLGVGFSIPGLMLIVLGLTRRRGENRLTDAELKVIEQVMRAEDEELGPPDDRLRPA